MTWLSSEKHRVIALRVLLLLAIVTSSYWSITQTIIDPVASYFSPFTRFWELAFGGLLATFATTTKFKHAGYLGIGILVASMFLLNSQSSYPGYLAWLPVAGTALLLWAPLKPLGIAPLRYVGDISYSLYLWHFIWLVLPTQIENPITDPTFSWLFLLGAVICAVLTYHFFERPIHKSLNLKSDSYSSLAVGIVSLASAWLVIALIENLWLRSIS
jgi:peptidoglycan/LPS O-acetylase OafA/YrhL